MIISVASNLVKSSDSRSKDRIGVNLAGLIHGGTTE